MRGGGILGADIIKDEYFPYEFADESFPYEFVDGSALNYEDNAPYIKFYDDIDKKNMIGLKNRIKI